MTFDPANPPPPAEAHKLIAQIAALLGVDETHDFDAIDDALQHLFGAVAGDRANVPKTDPGKMELRALLTPGQRKACDALGCSPKDFLYLAGKRASFR